ncbi:IclR family transcriptional regulator [Halovivax cerinus]|uniref:IclR family transcriptional regulator n=1 Tax=Halovivax cerinus TaxID=1487865 RepID=A0ABD5NQW7_9EURY|nr:IclR family transcriptional regulator [Halovivax cerinus]
MAEDSPAGEIKSVRRAIEILEWIHEHDGARLTELVDALGLARSTVHNHLTTLRELGYLTKEGNAYQLSLQFLHLGEHARHRKPGYSRAHSAVEQLASETNEEVDFTVPENGRMISVYHSVGDQHSSGLQVGRWFHMHSSAAGKAVLAEMPEADVDRIVERWGLPARTDKTITTRDALSEELETVSARGYAINDQELLDGYHSIGVAVEYPNGDVFGALTVGGPTYRIKTALKSTDILETLERAAETIEAGLTASADADGNWWRDESE